MIRRLVRTAGLSSLLTAIAAGAGQVSVADFPRYEPDLAQIRVLMKTFDQGFRQYSQDPEGTASLAARHEQTKGYLVEKFREYEPLIDAKTPEGSRMNTAMNALLRSLNLFAGKWARDAKTFDQDFDQHLVRAEQKVQQGVKTKAPGLIDAALVDLDRAGDMLTIYAGWKGPADERLAGFQAKLEAAREMVGTTRAEVAEALVARVEAPRDAYHGEERNRLEALIRDEWTATYPEDDILGVRFHARTWKRTQRLSWDEGARAWERADTSVLPVKVIVKKNDTTATIYPAYVNRDNVTGAVNIGVQTKTREYVIHDILIEKLR